MDTSPARPVIGWRKNGVSGSLAGDQAGGAFDLVRVRLVVDAAPSRKLCRPASSRNRSCSSQKGRSPVLDGILMSMLTMSTCGENDP